MQKFNHKTITEKHRRFYFIGVCDIGYLLLNDSNFSKKKKFSRGYRIKQGTQQIIAYNVLQLLGLIESISKYYSRDTRLGLNEQLA